MSQTEFILTYDGPAMERHEMNVRDLAPAMLAVGELFEAMNALFNGKSAQLGVNVRAHQPGCFKVAFDIFQTIKDDAIPFLTGPSVVGLNNLLQLVIGGSMVVGVSCKGVIWLIRKLKGRRPTRIETITPKLSRIFIDDQSYDIPIELLDAYQDLRIRRALEGFITKPLRKDGISHLVIEQGQRSQRVEKAEAEYFAAPQPDIEIIVDETRRSAFNICDLSFDEHGFWRLFDGGNPIKARIEDAKFLRQIEENEIRFAKDDTLVCLFHFVQRRTARGIENEYSVIEVLEHIPAPRQLPLPEITQL